MKQHNIKVFWQYYRSITAVNILFSAVMALITQNVFWMPILFTTIGIGAGILFFNYYFSNQYYFYHNMGYTRKKLAMNTFFVNLPIAAVVLALLIIA